MMLNMKVVCAAISVSALSACSSGSSDSGVTDFVADTVTENPDGTIDIALNGETFDLPVPLEKSTDEQLDWFEPGLVANAFTGTNVVALGGVQDGEIIAAVDGDLLAAPSTQLFYDTRVIVNTAVASEELSLELSFDPSDNALFGGSPRFSVDGIVEANGAAAGTVIFDGDSANFEGGLYEGNEVAGAFENDTFGGIFFGTEDDS